MRLRDAVRAVLIRYQREIPEALDPDTVVYALRRDMGLTAERPAVMRCLAALDGEHVAWRHDDGTWTARPCPGFRRGYGGGRGHRRNGTAPHHVHRSALAMRGSVLIFPLGAGDGPDSE